MIMRNCLFGMILVLVSCAYAATSTNPIGTVSARGDMSVDGYFVLGNGTLFNGTAVETDQSTATLRLVNGTEITLAVNSRGIVYSDHLVLTQGKSQMKASGAPFLLEADGLSVTPSAPNTLGIVALSPANSVEVAAVTGELQVTQDSDSAVAHVVAGAAMSFHSLQETAPPPGSTFMNEVEGLVSAVNGNYFLTTDGGAKYQLVTGKELRKFTNKKVVVSGFVQSAATASEPTELLVTSININGAGAGGGSKKALIGIAVGGGAAGAAVAIAEATKSSASR
jgi:hypothetical protein